MARIKVAASTEAEVKQTKARLEDALYATRAAVEEGIAPGGGVALLRAVAACKPSGLNEDETDGYNIVLLVCRAPPYWSASNTGKDGSVICERILEGSGHVGYNAAEERFEDLLEAGVIDPTKVTRTALQNAASVATLLLTSDAVVAEKPQKKHEGNGHIRPDEMY